MKKVFALAAAMALLCLGVAAQADVFNLETGLTNLETVAVGDPENAGDVRYGGYGSIGHDYNVGKYEVTAAQYTDFLNHKAKCDGDPYGLYNAAMGDPSGSLGCNIQRSGGGTVADPYTYSVADDWANRPVNYVSYWDACRFANWLHNGQGGGDTENGAYTIPNGYNGDDGRNIVRNGGWKWAVTSDDEWYKAAYYKGEGTNAGYWDYPTKSNTAPSNMGADDYTDPGNHADYMIWNGSSYIYSIGSPYYRTNVGEFENSPSAYGTFDQGGNVWEWTEAWINDGNTYHVMRGGSFGSDNSGLRASYGSYYCPPISEGSQIGFRVAEAVPEPSSIVILACGLVSVMGLIRRRV